MSKRFFLFGFLALSVSSVRAAITPVVENFTSLSKAAPDHSVLGWGSGTIRVPPAVTDYQRLKINLNIDSVAAASADLTGDGYADLIVAGIHTSLPERCTLQLFKGQAVTPFLTTLNTSLKYRPVNTSASALPIPCSSSAPVIVLADFNADGFRDIFYADIAEPALQGKINSAFIYFNTTTSAALFSDTFTQVNVSSFFNNIQWHLGAMPVTAADYNQDGWADLVAVSSGGTSLNNVTVWLLQTISVQNLGLFNFSKKNILQTTNLIQNNIASAVGINLQYQTIGNVCPGTVTSGVTHVFARDIDRDTDIDLVLLLGTQQEQRTFLQNVDGSFFEKTATRKLNAVPRYGFLTDVNGDAFDDLVSVFDRKPCSLLSNGSDYIANTQFGYVAAYLQDMRGNFFENAINISDLTDVASFAVNADLNQDGNQDFMIGQPGNNGTVFVFISRTLANLFSAQAIASTSILKPLSGSQSILDVSLSSLTATNLDFSKIFVSNDGGKNYEFIESSEMPPNSNLHYFKHFGQDFVWQIFLNQSSNNERSLFGTATNLQASLSQLTFQVESIPSQTYARVGGVLGSWKDLNGITRTYLFSPSFEFPGYTGHLMSFDVTSLTQLNAAATQVLTLPVLFDAGALLRSRSSRVVYTPSFSGNPPVGTLVNSSLPLLAPNLFDNGHSSPVFVGPSYLDARYFGVGYDAYKTSQSAKTPVVYMGANDGLLHAFHAKTGVELWSYMPSFFEKKYTNLTQNQKGIDVLEHDAFVDGPIVFGDVQDGTSFKTILIAGMSQGQAANNHNYYAALDISDINQTPRFLWEFTDGVDTQKTGCINDQRNAFSYSTACASLSNTVSCSSQTFDRVFTTSTLGGITYIEADAEYASSRTIAPLTNATLSTSNSAPVFSGNYLRASFSSAVCATTDMYNCGIRLNYKIFNPTTLNNSALFLLVKGSSSSTSISFRAEIDGALLPVISTTTAAWQWISLNTSGVFGNTFNLNPGYHDITIWLPNSADLESITIAPANTSTTVLNTLLTSSCMNDVSVSACSNVTYTSMLQNKCPLTTQSCCVAGANTWCLNQCNEQLDSVMGETWSKPSIGYIASLGKYVVFFASGYKNRPEPNVGKSLYMLDALTGNLLQQWSVDDVPASTNNVSTLENTLPTSPALVDLNGDGSTDRIYLTDLEGRIYKLDASSGAPNTWVWCLVFDAAQYDAYSKRVWAPIITKPAIALLNPNAPNLYFGTGGDDSAPDNIMYKFYSIRDESSFGSCASVKYESNLTLSKMEWIIGDNKTNDDTLRDLESTQIASFYEGQPGDKYWADPVIVNNTTVYFSTLYGKAEAIDYPQSNTRYHSKQFAYAIRSFTGASGQRFTVGTSVFAPKPWISLGLRTRSAPLISNASVDHVTRPFLGNVFGETPNLFFQNSGSDATSTPKIVRLQDGGVAPSLRVKILGWNEISL